MLQLVVGAARLIVAAQSAGAQVVVYDTCGLVEPGLGGLALKQAKLDLLRPERVCALQRADELEPLLIPLERRGGVQVQRLRPSSAVVSRDQVTRRRYREAQYTRYFRAAAASYPWTGLTWRRSRRPVSAWAGWSRWKISKGSPWRLGVVSKIGRASHQLTLISPLMEHRKVHTLRLGDLRLDPVTGAHEVWLKNLQVDLQVNLEAGLVVAR